VAEAEKDDQSSQESAASNGGSNLKEDLITIQPQSYSWGPSTSRGDSVSAASHGARSSVRDRRGSSKPTNSAAAYNTVATTPRNYLIHVYKSQDNLMPFVSVQEFNKLLDRIKTSIWSFVEEHGADKDLSVKNWAFHREKNIGLIFCTSEARQKRVIKHMITNDL
jgi:hypothetical protein